MSIQLTRKEFLGWLSTSAVGLVAPVNAFAKELEQRVAQLLQEYDRQGIHRTGTKADEFSAHWLAAHAQRLGSTVTLESFALDRVDPQACFLEASGKRIAGVPIFDASFTDAAGLRGRLGALGSDAEIAWIELPPSAEYGESYEPTRRHSQHKAIVVISKGARPGLCLINAPEFLQPYGAPLLQVSSEDGEWVRQQAQAQTHVHFVAAGQTHPHAGAECRRNHQRHGRQTCAAGRDDASQWLVACNQRARRRAGLLAGSAACSGCQSPAAHRVFSLVKRA